MAKVIREIMFKGRKIIDDQIKQELRNQGHYNLGNLERSLTATVTESEDLERIQGMMAEYWINVNEGFRPSSASWSQLPFLIRYFMTKGLDEKRAKQYAAGTIVTWMKEGAHTNKSIRFARGTPRTRFKFLDIALQKALPKAEKVILAGMDKLLQAKINKVKNITI